MTPNAEKIRVGRDEFWRVPAAEMLGAVLGETGHYILPIRKEDAKLYFPHGNQIDHNFYFYVSSGAIQHSVEREQPYGPSAPIQANAKHAGFSASQLRLFDDVDMDIECLSVLNAHGWISNNAKICPDLLARVSKIDGPCSITHARIRFGDNWECFVIERASVHFAEPLSRLWYAANLRSLYYIHEDDIRLGYLWAEYHFRMRSELDTLRGEKVLSGAEKAAEQTGSIHSDLRTARFKLMTELVPEIGTDKAAAECEIQGLGAAQAIKRQWNRFQKKKRDT